MKLNYPVIGLILAIALALASAQALHAQTANSGAQQVVVDIPTDAEGRTIEQKNIAKRLVEDNQPGATKEFYVFSPTTGQALMHSTVQGKITSSGKRLSPLTVTPGGQAMPISINGTRFYTTEVIQDDGTYGSSTPYVYWWDTGENYHQHFFTDGQIIVVTSKPLRLRNTESLLELNQEQ